MSSVTHAIAAVNSAVCGTNPEETMAALKSEFTQMSSLDDTCAERYHVALQRAREEKEEVCILFVAMDIHV